LTSAARNLGQHTVRIGYLTHYFPPETGAPAGRAFDLSTRWVAAGHAVEVLTAVPNHPDGRIRPAYKGQLNVRETIDGVSVQRRWLLPNIRRSPLSVLLNHGSLTLHTIVAAALEQVPKPDVWIASSPPLFTGAAGAVIAATQRGPLVLEVRDLWPDYFEEMGVLKNRAILATLHALEAKLYRSAAAVITVAETARQRLIEQKGLDEAKTYCIPNGADLAKFVLADGTIQQTRKNLGLGTKFVVAYVGNHGLGQGLQGVVRCAALLRDENDVHFLFVGDGAEKAKVVHEAERLRLANTTFLSTRPREDVPAFYGAANVCLVPLADVPSFRNTIPSKIFEILGVGRPIIGALEGEGADVIRRSKAGLVVPPQNPEALAEAIRTIRALSDGEREVMAKQGRQFVKENFNRDDLAQRYLEILLSVARRDPSDS
jgi:glycosyltransferase involved in cell wall biosynthesis